jgi:carboxypeptidase family protein/TonB-dependent receptor-like protein
MTLLALHRVRHGVLLTLVALAAGTLPAQARQAPALRVRAVDAQQLAVPGATCSLIAASGAPAAVPAITDEQGTAVFDRLPAGTYTLRVDLDGFSSFIRPNLLIASGITVDVEAALGPAAVSQSVSVTAPSAAEIGIVAGAAPPATIGRRVLQRLPLPVSSVKEALPLLPGVIRSGTGELNFKGASEEQSGLRVNGMSAADPASGAFRLSLPVDAVEGVQVFLHPYTAEHGEFTGALTEIDTRAGGDRWRFELNDFLPDLRFVNGKIVGVAEDSPHLNLSGPLFSKRLFLSQSAAYTIAKRPVRGLKFPFNETRTEAQSYFTQLDFSLRPGHHQTVTLGYFPERREFVGLDVFRPQPVTPSIRQRDAIVTARDNSEIAGGLLSSSISVSRYDTRVWSRGPLELTITPTGEEGNYFATQEGRSARLEILEVYSLPTRHWLRGSHDVKFGVDLNSSSSRLDYRARPVNVVRGDGTLARRIAFDQAPPIRASNQELVGFAQDRWSMGGRVTIDLGVRFEDQRVADATVIAPRAGFAWTPSVDGSTVIRGGVGLFFDKVPLNIRSFAHYPARTMTRYGRDGVTVIDRRHVTNLLVDAVDGPEVDPTVPTVIPTEFVPENLTWNLQVDRTFTAWMAARASFVTSHSHNLYIVTPKMLAGHSVIELSSIGSSVYRALEVSARFGRPEHAMSVSYTRSRARGDLNTFAAAFGDLASPVIRPNQYSQLPVDTPHRLIGWGTIALPRRLTLAPIVEVRSGFPYAVRDAEQAFVGVRNADTTRFPRFFAIDLEVAKELQVTRKYAVRLSLRGFNLTNHFNPRDVHANTADPAFGRFLASYRRYFAGGFDIVF